MSTDLLQEVSNKTKKNIKNQSALSDLQPDPLLISGYGL